MTAIEFHVSLGPVNSDWQKSSRNFKTPYELLVIHNRRSSTLQPSGAQMPFWNSKGTPTSTLVCCSKEVSPLESQQGCCYAYRKGAVKTISFYNVTLYSLPRVWMDPLWLSNIVLLSHRVPQLNIRRSSLNLQCYLQVCQIAASRLRQTLKNKVWGSEEHREEPTFQGPHFEVVQSSEVFAQLRFAVLRHISGKSDLLLKERRIHVVHDLVYCTIEILASRTCQESKNAKRQC